MHSCEIFETHKQKNLESDVGSSVKIHKLIKLIGKSFIENLQARQSSRKYKDM
jgi:hypothetical protein